VVKEFSSKIEASTQGTLGQIRIIDFISMYSETSASAIRTIVDDFIAKGIASTEIYINSRGGSTIEAVEITNELKRLPNVTLKVGAVAASAATYFMTKFKNSAFSNSQFMIHPPRLTTSGNIDQIKSDLKLLENTTNDYKSSYAAKMGKTEDEIEELFKKGDYWMNAKEAKEIGLLDEIIEEPMAITPEDVERLVACGAPHIPKPTETETEYTMKNRNQIIAALKLPADATDEQIEQAVKDSQAKASQVEALTAAQKAARKKEADTLVDKAILDKKITADTKEKWVKAAEADLENTKAILENMPGIQKPNPNEEEDGAEARNREKWTMEDYQSKDPDALAKMMNDEPEKFEKLQAEYFGK